MAVVRATALSNFSDVVRSVGGDPDALLTAAGLNPQDEGRSDVFLPLSKSVAALELAATTTSTSDFGRRLGAVQGIEILGPVGVAARTASTVAEALGIFERFLGAYSPGLAVRVGESDSAGLSFLEYRILDPSIPASTQHSELALGVILRVLRHLLGDLYRPVRAHLPHQPLTPAAGYREYYGCPVEFNSATTGFTIHSADLTRALKSDAVSHEALVQYLQTVVGNQTAMRASVEALVRQLLPSGRVNLALIGNQLEIHPKALQRRLASEGTTFAEIMDSVRRETAQRLLRNTGITMAHLARELGYAEQTVLTRSCHRWFGEGPAAHRKRLQRA